MDARLVQGIFDDLNPVTRGQWMYPDTRTWDPDRNTQEFIDAMAAWREHGLVSFMINLQGGCPYGYCRTQPWVNTAFDPEGSLRPDFMNRLEPVLDRRTTRDRQRQRIQTFGPGRRHAPHRSASRTPSAAAMLTSDEGFVDSWRASDSV
jgi:hypothetical protein